MCRATLAKRSVVLQLYRRYGTRRVSISHPIPVQQQGPPARDAQDQAAAQAGAFVGCNVTGRSPDSDMSASQYSANSGSGRHIRLYPDEPLEPGTPSNESTMATQQLWDALQRGRATAYRVSPRCGHPCIATSVAPTRAFPAWMSNPAIERSWCPSWHGSTPTQPHSPSMLMKAQSCTPVQASFHAGARGLRAFSGRQ